MPRVVCISASGESREAAIETITAEVREGGRSRSALGKVWAIIKIAQSPQFNWLIHWRGCDNPERGGVRAKPGEKAGNRFGVSSGEKNPKNSRAKN